VFSASLKPQLAFKEKKKQKTKTPKLAAPCKDGALPDILQSP